MPQLGTERLVTLTLPSSTKDDPAEVTFNLTVTGGMAADLYASGNQADAVFQLLTKAIKSWNFTDADGAAVPVTVENVRKLTAEDFTFLSNKLTKQIDLSVSTPAVSKDEKKDS